MITALFKTTILLSIITASSSSCPDRTWLADGYCDPECNNEEHSFDGGDCCEHSCFSRDYDCGINGYDCIENEHDGDFQYKMTKEYIGFEITLSCDTGVMAGYPVGFAYTLTNDRRVEEELLGRKSIYMNDPSVPLECQQQFKTSSSSLPSYRTEECSREGRKNRLKNPLCYDRGHVVMSNSIDGTSNMKKDTNYVTNLVPLSSGFNQGGGSWKETEDIIECHHTLPNVEKLEIFGGLIYDDESNDYFLKTHHIPTPDLLYKVVVKHFTNDTNNNIPDVIAWVMQNKATDRADRLDKRFDGMDENGNFEGDLINVRTLKRLVNDPLDLLPEVYTQSAFDAGESWDRPKKCGVWSGIVDNEL